MLSSFHLVQCGFCCACVEGLAEPCPRLDHEGLVLPQPLKSVFDIIRFVANKDQLDHIQPSFILASQPCCGCVQHAGRLRTGGLKCSCRQLELSSPGSLWPPSLLYWSEGIQYWPNVTNHMEYSFFTNVSPLSVTIHTDVVLKLVTVENLESTQCE